MVLHCVDVPEFIHQFLSHVAYSHLSTDNLKSQGNKLRQTKSFVNQPSFNMIVYNLPMACRRRKRNEMTPDCSRQSRDKKNKLQDRAGLRKAQSLVSPVYPTSTTVMLWKLPCFKSRSLSASLNVVLWPWPSDFETVWPWRCSESLFPYLLL
jgi:hypothetical protein